MAICGMMNVWADERLEMRVWKAIVGYSQVSKRVYGRRLSLVILKSRNASMDGDRRLFSSFETRVWKAVIVGYSQVSQCVYGRRS